VQKELIKPPTAAGD